ncbi:AAA family ATPase [bacterium]|nr:AAA family ATPase [bacterium]
MNIYLIGFMGSGKSTYAGRLAKQLGFDVLDLDKRIEEQYQRTISSWFEEDNEEGFREAETAVLHSTKELKSTIIACGGGTPCFNGNMEWMNQNGFTVYLKLLENQLVKRLKNAKDERPLLADVEEDELHLFVHEKLTERSRFYAQATLVIQPEQFQAGQLATYYKAHFS